MTLVIGFVLACPAAIALVFLAPKAFPHIGQSFSTSVTVRATFTVFVHIRSFIPFIIRVLDFFQCPRALRLTTSPSNNRKVRPDPLPGTPSSTDSPYSWSSMSLSSPSSASGGIGSSQCSGQRGQRSEFWEHNKTKAPVVAAIDRANPAAEGAAHIPLKVEEPAAAQHTDFSSFGVSVPASSAAMRRL